MCPGLGSVRGAHGELRPYRRQVDHLLDVCNGHGDVDRLLACVSNEELQDTVIEALSSLVSHPDTHKYPNKLMEVSGKDV